MVQLLKRHKVLIKTRLFVIVRLKGWERVQRWYKTIIKSLQQWWIIDLTWIWALVFCFVRLINAASAAPHSKKTRTVVDQGRLLQQGCLNLKDTSVFNLCLLVLLQRIYYVFNHSPRAQTVPLPSSSELEASLRKNYCCLVAWKKKTTFLS